MLVMMNGAAYSFAARKALKRAHAPVAATINGESTTVDVIVAKNFADNRVWIHSPSLTGRFLVPATVDLTGTLEILVADGSAKYDREALRTRTETRAKKSVAVEVEEESEE